MSSDIHFQALCNAVENERLDKCRSILLATSNNQGPGHKGPVDLTVTNNDGFTPLDLAFMTGHGDLLDLILGHGGKEGHAFPGPEAISSHLHSLIHESKKQVEKFGQLIKAAHQKGSHIPNLPTQLSQSQLKECEKQQTLWQKRMATLKRLKSGFDSAGCPHGPAEVGVEVLGSDSISVRLRGPENFGSRSLYTKCRIQWSNSDSFARLDGELTVTEVRNELDFRIDSLLEGQRYFVRASFGNPKGFGPFSASTPKSVVPSSWRSVEDRMPRIRDQREVCLKTFLEIGGDLDEDSHEPQRFNKRKGLRNLFSSSSAPKFQRTLHPSRLYLACVFFHEDKVLMTNEEVLPIMEVDDEIPGGVMSEFQWLARLCFIFKDVERLRQETAKVNGNAVNCRAKILQTVMNMQHSLGIVELGSPYHKPFRHADGSVIFSLVNHVKHPKQMVSLSLKWVPLSKVQRRSSFDSQVSSMDVLRHSLREQILFHQVCSIKLNRGLYLCYVQAESSIDSMCVVVSNTSPSILPYVKVRDNPHVTADEWSWIGQLGRVSTEASSMQAPSPTTNFLAGEDEEGSEVFGEQLLRRLRPSETQHIFGRQLVQSVERLLDYLEIPQLDRNAHRIFDSEIVELSHDISVILVLPSADHVCSMADNKPPLNLQRNDLLGLNLQLFESVHLSTYHHDLISAFFRVLLHLDLDLMVAKQNHREAFSNQELEDAQNVLTRLLDHQQNIEDSWKSMRWLLDVLSQGRNKSAKSGITYEHLTDWYERQTETPDDSHIVYSNEAEEKQQQSGRFFRQDGVAQINSAIPYDPQGCSSSASGTRNHNQPRGVGHRLSRTPTTRSDPLEFNLSGSSNNNKENEVHNFPRLPMEQQPQIPATPTPGNSGNTFQSSKKTSSSYSSLTFSSHQSTNSSLSSNNEHQPLPPEEQHAAQPQYENQMSREEARSNKGFDPRVAQSGRFSNIPSLGSSSKSSNQNRFQSSPEPNVLQVFAAYETGLASGTSVKLNVNHDTTTREVIDLVIKQLNMAVILKGKEGPIYENDKLRNFCLVAVIGSRERCLRDDFKPLNLQNPWQKGKLFVRMKNDLLAAIDHISRHSTLL